MKLIYAASLLLLLGACSTQSAATHAAPVTATTPTDPKAIEAILAAIKSGWENGDAAPFEEHFLDFAGARYVESGGQNAGLRDLVEHHVVPEKDYLSALSLDFTNIEVNFEGNFAWAVADVHVKGTVKSDGREFDKRGYETFLLRWVGGAWRVVHTHSSTRPVKK